MQKAARAVVGLAWFLACGGDDGGDPDGGGATADAGADASEADGSPAADAAVDGGTGTVTVTVRAPDGPIQGADVLFFDGGGELISAELTGEAGQARAVFESTGMVVIHHRQVRDGSHVVAAWLSVAAGSDIVFGGRAGPGELDATLTVDGPSFPGAVRYQADTPCGTAMSDGADPSATLELASCTPSTHLVWSALDLDPIEGKLVVVASALEPEVDIAAGDHSVKTAFAEPVPVTAEVSGIPAAVERVRLRYSLHTVHGRVMAGSDALEEPIAGTVKVVGDYPELASLPAVSGQFDVDLERIGIGAIEIHARADHVAGPILDAVGGLIPTIRQPEFDPSARRFTWLEEGGGSADVSVATLEIGTDPPVRWLAVAPHGRPELVLPLLPEPFEFLNPRADSLLNQRAVDLYSHPEGYAAFRSDFTAAADPERIAAGERLLRSSHTANPPPP